MTDTVPLAFGSDYLEGLLAKVDLGPALLSPMSGYEKSPIPDINGKLGDKTCARKDYLLRFEGELKSLAVSVAFRT